MRTPLTRFLYGSLTFVALALVFFSCQKEAADNIPAGMNKLSVYLTDGPLDYDHVYVDIRSIAVKLDTCRRGQGNGDDDDDDEHEGHQHGCDDDNDNMYSHCQIWDTLNINPGVYDLLSLSNGVDTLLASGFLLNGKILRIKFTIGDNNTVVVDSVTHPLRLIGNQRTVYVNIRREHLDSLSSNNFQLFLDFNLQRSVFYRNGQYWLKPYLKPFGLHQTGEIEGEIEPDRSWRMVKAYNNTDTGYAYRGGGHHHGDDDFKIRGLDAGTYSVFIEGKNGYRDTTITGVVVQRGRKTSIDDITLHQ